MLYSSRKVEKYIKIFTKYWKVYLYYVTFSQEIRLTGIVILIATNLL